MAHSSPAVDAHSRKARGKPGDPLPAAGLSTSMHHWGANGHYQRQAPPLPPVRVRMRRSGRAKMPEVGPHPEGLKAETGEIDPPPEDPGNADEASIAMILWTMSPTMWSWDGNETSLT